MMLTEIQQAITEAIKREFTLDVANIELEVTDPTFGDVATNVAFHLAKELKLAPKAIAERLAAATHHSDIIKASAAGAGFVNLTLAPSFWLHRLAEIGPGYAKNVLGKGKKVQVEFISANPTGPLTLGNARGGYIGDVLARVLAHCGYDVIREYYFNDAGTQIAKLVESVKVQAGLIQAEDVQYRGEYIEELAKNVPDIDRDDEKSLGIELSQYILKQYIEPAITKMGVKFDEWFNEHTLIDSGQFDQALLRLKTEGLLLEDGGATWISSSSYGDERDRVIVKSSGDVTYLGTDIPYHLNIFEHRDFDVAIKVWGADHVGQVPSLKLTMQKLAPDKQLDFVILQWVRLMKQGVEVKMSKRAGTYVTVDELIDEVGSDVARFFFLMRSADSQLDFDLDLAKEHSQKNPLFYLLYTYARAHSILEQASKKGLKVGSDLQDLSDRERLLVRHMSLLPKLVTEVANTYAVHKLSFYGLELAKLFHDYYEEERILQLPPDHAAGRLYFIQQYIHFMDAYAGLLGIKLLKKM